MAKADELRAQLDVVELEEELVKVKGKKGLDPGNKEHRKLKMELREARKKAREAREAEMS